MLQLSRIASVVFFAALLPFSAAAAGNTSSQPIALCVVNFVLENVSTAFGGEAVAPPAGAVVAAARHAPAQELRFTMTPEIAKFVTHYASGRGRRTTREGLERSVAYRERAEEIFAAEGVPTRLVWLAQVESGWKSEAVSPVGAGGVWQFMPATAKDFGMQVDAEVDERLDFDKATHASARYLRRLSRRYDGNWELAIGAYNCGEGNMDKAIDKAGVSDFWTICRLGLLPEETANYVPKVLAAGIVCCNAQQFGLDQAG